MLMSSNEAFTNVSEGCTKIGVAQFDTHHPQGMRKIWTGKYYSVGDNLKPSKTFMSHNTMLSFLMPPSSGLMSTTPSSLPYKKVV